MFIRSLLFFATLLFVGCCDNIQSYVAEKGEQLLVSNAHITSNGKNCSLWIRLENGRRSFWFYTSEGISSENRRNTYCLALHEDEPMQIIKRNHNYFWKVGSETTPELIPLN